MLCCHVVFLGGLKNENGLTMSIVKVFIQFNKHNILFFVTDLYFENLNSLQVMFLFGLKILNISEILSLCHFCVKQVSVPMFDKEMTDAELLYLVMVNNDYTTSGFSLAGSVNL